MMLLDLTIPVTVHGYFNPDVSGLGNAPKPQYPLFCILTHWRGGKKKNIFLKGRAAFARTTITSSEEKNVE